MLDLELDVSYESRKVEDWEEREVPSEAFEALNLSVFRSQLDPDFHAVAVLSVQGLSRYADGPPETGKPQGPSLQLDVFALSGPGDLEFVIQDVEGAGPGTGQSLLGDDDFSDIGFGFLEVLFGIAFSMSDPPEEGLAYHARATFFPWWTRTASGRPRANALPIPLAAPVTTATLPRRSRKSDFPIPIKSSDCSQASMPPSRTIRFRRNRRCRLPTT